MYDLLPMTRLQPVRPGELALGSGTPAERWTPSVRGKWPDVKPTGEAAFETVIEAHLRANGCVAVPGDGFDRGRAVFPDTALGFLRETRDERGRNPDFEPIVLGGADAERVRVVAELVEVVHLPGRS